MRAREGVQVAPRERGEGARPGGVVMATNEEALAFYKAHLPRDPPGEIAEGLLSLAREAEREARPFTAALLREAAGRLTR